MQIIIDNKNVFVYFQLASPIKSINIQGHVQTTAPYKIYIKNMYDNTKPINAELVMDPSDVSLDVNMNYDIGKNIIILYDRCCLIKILCVKFLPIYISKCRHFKSHTCMFKT